MKWGQYSPRIAYAHNILFDFAVSKLVLKDTAAGLLEFIAAKRHVILGHSIANTVKFYLTSFSSSGYGFEQIDALNDAVGGLYEGISGWLPAMALWP